MPIFLDTTGKTPLSIGVCARCNEKYPLADLMPDPNSPGLLVCEEDRDVLDPYRLPPPAADRIAIENARPDVSLSNGPVAVFANQIAGISSYQQPVPWVPLTQFQKGDTVTPQNVNLETTTLPQNFFMALNAGRSGAAVPAWPDSPGVTILDGTIIWLNMGIYLI